MITVTLSYLQTSETLRALKTAYWESVELYRFGLKHGFTSFGPILTDEANAINILNEARLTAIRALA